MMLTLDEGAVAEGAATPFLLPITHELTSGGRLIFVTNRGAVEHHSSDTGTFEARPGAGGVVSGLLCAARERPVSWISVAMTDGDRELARTGKLASTPVPQEISYVTPRLVYVPEQTYSRYYDEISNRLLWFAHHGLLDADKAWQAPVHESWHEGYVTVNRVLAEAVIAELELHGEATPVMFHDYHLYLAPAMVRQRVPDARMEHFVHVPWPAPDAWNGVPDSVLRAIYTGLAANDVVGFQTSRDARNFLAGAQRYLPGARVSHDPDELHWEQRRTLVRAYPIALTPESVRESARSMEAVRQVRELRRQLLLDEGQQLIVRVDRIEPTKNIVRGFEAYGRLLAEHPELHGRVIFLALLVPSRESVPEYQVYAQEVRQAIERVNAAYGRSGWDPVVAIYGNDRARALACMRDYDVLLVNSLADGMNLVVKEGGLVNARDGVIVLSERAGAYAQLQTEVLGIAPLDVEATAQALYSALTMPALERRRRAKAVRAILEREDAALWLGRQLADLVRVTGLPENLENLQAADAEPTLVTHRAREVDERVVAHSALLRGIAFSSEEPLTPARHVSMGGIVPLPRPRATAEPPFFSHTDLEPPALADVD